MFRFAVPAVAIFLATGNLAYAQNLPAAPSPQTSMPGMNMGPGQSMDSAPRTPAAKDTGTVTFPMNMQEQENPDLHTGTTLPAPELLNDVAKRPALRLEDFTHWAAQSNPTLAQMQAMVRQAQGQAHQAGLYPNPSVGYSGEHIRGGSYHGGEQGAYVQQTIVLGGKLGLRRDVYREQANANAADADTQQIRVRDGVTEAFYRTLAAQAVVVVCQRLMGVAEDATNTAHRLANVGQADATDVLQAEVESEAAKVHFVSAQREFLSQFGMLAAMAGKPELPVAPLAGDLENPPAIDTEGRIAAIIASSPEVKRAEAEIAVAQARIKSAKREPVPDLTLRAGEWWSGEITEGTNTSAGPMSFASASVDLPLWNRNQGNKEAAQAELERAEAELARTRLAIRERAEPIAHSYLTARFTADRYRTALLPRAKRAYELSSSKYGQMGQAYPQVLIAQRTLFGLQVDYLHALEDEWTGAVALQNDVLSGALDEPMSNATDSTTLNLPGSSGGSE